MYFIASSFSEWSPIRRTESDEIDIDAADDSVADDRLKGQPLLLELCRPGRIVGGEPNRLISRQPESHSATCAGPVRDEKSPWSRICVAMSAMAPMAAQVSAPPTLTRCAPASMISCIVRWGRARTLSGRDVASDTAWISSLLRNPGAYRTSAPARS